MSVTLSIPKSLWRHCSRFEVRRQASALIANAAGVRFQALVERCPRRFATCFPATGSGS